MNPASIQSWQGRSKVSFQTYCKELAVLLGFFLCGSSLIAGDLIEISPATDKILMLYIKDGHIDYKAGLTGSNTVYNRTTETGAAESLKSYHLSSKNDPNYSSPKEPIHIGRKSKSVEWNSVYPGSNDIAKFIWGHWVYLELPTALKQGSTYTLTTAPGLVDNGSARTFTYDVHTLRSETVRVNQVGFPLEGPKKAYLSHWMGSFNNETHASGALNLSDKAGNEFRLINQTTGEAVYTGTVPKSVRWRKSDEEHYNPQFEKGKNYTHADVYELEFDSFKTPGEYVISVDGIGCSFPFHIGNDTTREHFYTAMRGLFFQRLGIVKLVEGTKTMPRDHHPDDFVWRYDQTKVSSEVAEKGFKPEAPRVFHGTTPAFAGGHYHDAGDWDHYGHHWKVPLSLMLLFDLAPTKFFDGEVGNKYKLSASDATWIDEGTNGLPDILDEAAWLLKFHLYARNSLKEHGATGGVPGYIGRDGCGTAAAAWDDKRDWFVSGENPVTTYYYAGAAAWFASCLGSAHRDYAMWKNEAESAWEWANAKKPANSQERGVAAACLYRLTGSPSYQTAFQAAYKGTPNDYHGTGDWQGLSTISLGMSVYAMLPPSHPALDTAFQTQVKGQIASNADGMQYRGTGKDCGHGASGMRMTHANPYAPFSIGILSTPKNLFYAVNHHLTGDSKYLDCIGYMSNYVLGGNQMNLCYLSGLGDRVDNNVFHPNSWALNDVNSKVYANENLPGYTTHGSAYTDYFSAYSDANEWVSRTEGSYPKLTGGPGGEVNDWPEGEERFNNRNSIAGSEFIIADQQRTFIFNLGYLKAMSNASSSPFVPNARPTVAINLTDGQMLPLQGFTLTATVSPDTRIVKYYRDWHYIGESRDKGAKFALAHVPWSEGTNQLITAVAIDNLGLISSPTAAGDATVNISDGSAPSVKQ